MAVVLGVLGLVGIGVLGLIAHELRYERIVHTLEVSEVDRERNERDLYAPAA